MWACHNGHSSSDRGEGGSAFRLVVGRRPVAYGGLAGQERLNFADGCEHPWLALLGHQRERAVVGGARVTASGLLQLVALPFGHPPEPVLMNLLCVFHTRNCTRHDTAWYGKGMSETSGASGARPPSSLFTQTKGVCANCRKPIRRASAGGDWYHRSNASSSCYPGRGSWKRATPRETED